MTENIPTMYVSLHKDGTVSAASDRSPSTIGMASACQSMSELRERMAVKFGREKVQMLLYLPPPAPGRKKPLLPPKME